MSLEVAESESSELMYLNFGPQYQGFREADNASLFHKVKTDIAVWLPHSSLYGPGGRLAALAGQILPGGGDRLRPAMQSAMQAILCAAAGKLEVADREIGGLLYPDEQGQGHGFVLFDESSGGGGAVLPLVLTGHVKLDQERHTLIREIVERARSLCTDCAECNAVDPFDQLRLDLPAISREEFLNRVPADRDNYRERQSCYKCLRSYKNQRVHHMLDRGDAYVVLDALLDGTPGATVGTVPRPAAPAGDEPATLPSSAMPTAEEFELELRPPGMPLNRQAPYRFRAVKSDAEPLLPAKFYLVRVQAGGSGTLVVGRVQEQVVGGKSRLRFSPGNANDNIRNTDISREDVQGLLID